MYALIMKKKSNMEKSLSFFLQTGAYASTLMLTRSTGCSQLSCTATSLRRTAIEIPLPSRVVCKVERSVEDRGGGHSSSETETETRPLTSTSVSGLPPGQLACKQKSTTGSQDAIKPVIAMDSSSGRNRWLASSTVLARRPNNGSSSGQPSGKHGLTESLFRDGAAVRTIFRSSAVRCTSLKFNVASGHEDLFKSETREVLGRSCARMSPSIFRCPRFGRVRLVKMGKICAQRSQLDRRQRTCKLCCTAEGMGGAVSELKSV